MTLTVVLQLLLILIGLEAVGRTAAAALRFEWRAWVVDVEAYLEARRRTPVFLPESWKPQDVPRHRELLIAVREGRKAR